MADFPAGIRCSGMIYLAGSFAATEYTTQAGNLLSFQRSNRETGGRLRIAFRGISRADAQSIRTHYQAEGTVRSWLLSAVLLDGAEYASEISSMRWRYAGPPQFLDITDDAHNVDLELEHVPAVVWIDRIIATARPAMVAAGSTATLIGPDVLPAIWSSRLLTAGSTSQPPEGTIALNPDGESYQAFYFTANGATDARVVVVKRTPAGTILWQRWTSGTITAPNVGFDSLAPVIGIMSDGGCVVACKYKNSATSDVTRVWRLEPDGDVAWQKDYTYTATGPVQLAHKSAAGEVLMLFSTREAPNNKPALVRLNAANGNIIGGREWLVDSVSTTAQRLHVLASGAIVILARFDQFSSADGKRSYLLEVSADLATVNACYAYGNPLANGAYTYDGALSTLSTGELMISTAAPNQKPGILRLSTGYAILNHYQLPRAVGGSFGLTPMGLAFSGTAGAYLGFGTDRSGYQMAVAGLGDNGTGLVYVSDLDTEYDPRSDQLFTSPVLDLERQRVVAHAAEANFSLTSNQVYAVGFSLRQATDAANVLDVGNSQSMRGITTEPATGSIGTNTTVTRYTVSATGASLSGTAAAASVEMVDAGSNLTWERKVLTA